MDRPFIGWLPEPHDKSAVFQGDCAEPGDLNVLCVPLTREVRDSLYDRLCIAFSGHADRHALAGLALATIGVVVPAKPRDELRRAS